MSKQSLPTHNNSIEKQDLNNKKKKVKLKKKIKLFILMLIAIIFLIVIFISIKKIFSWSSDNQKTKEIIEEIKEELVIEEVEANDNEILVNEPEEKESDYWYYVKMPLINVNFENLIKKNKDTVGWLNINNTNINYPFVQTSDNKYYLNHSFDKSYNNAGWVFLDYRNSNDLNNKNSILYAHGRNDKTMFGTLSNVLKENWYENKDNHIIRISTPTENTLWQIFSVYKIKVESYYITTDFVTNEDYQVFLDTISKRSIHNFNTSVNIEDKLLTLSTCYSTNVRTVVHAKLIKKEAK